MTTARGADRPPGRGGAQRPGSAPGRPAGHGPTGPRGSGPTGHGGSGPLGSLASLKALAIVAVAVALGAYLLSLGGHAAPASAPTTTSTTAPPSTTSTTAPAQKTTAAKPSTAVKVLVANASHTTGMAHYYTQQLASAGWGTLTPVTATTVESASTVYYASGQQADAAAVAASLGLPASSVKSIATPVPVSTTSGADVVVVAGEDLGAKVPTTTTTSS